MRTSPRSEEYANKETYFLSLLRANPAFETAVTGLMDRTSDPNQSDIIYIKEQILHKPDLKFAALLILEELGAQAPEQAAKIKTILFGRS